MYAVSKLTKKKQTSIPVKVVKLLQLTDGDSIAYDTTPDGRVFITKSKPIDYAMMKAMEPMLSEWNSKEDDEAFDDL